MQSEDVKMQREDVVEYIIRTAIRLEENEHVTDLVIGCRTKELKEVEIPITASVAEWLACNNLKLKDEEIPENHCFAVAMWLRQCAFAYSNDDSELFEDVNLFVQRLAIEAGDIGKSIAYKVMKKGKSIVIMSANEFFSHKDATAFDDEVHHD